MLYRIEVEAENEGKLETILADGRWKYKAVPEKKLRVDIHVVGGTINIELPVDGGGKVLSDLHRTEEEWSEEFGEDNLVDYNRYEGGLDVLESFILSCAVEGIDIGSREFSKAVVTTLDAIDNS